MIWFILITWRPQPVTQRLTTCNQASPGTVPVAVWTRSFNLTGRERFAAGRFLAHVDANRTLAPSTLESGSRPEQVWTRPYMRHMPETPKAAGTCAPKAAGTCEVPLQWCSWETVPLERWLSISGYRMLLVKVSLECWQHPRTRELD